MNSISTGVLTTLLAVLAASFSGVGVYLWLDADRQELKQETELQIRELEEQITELEAELDLAVTADELSELKVIDRNFDRPHKQLTYSSYADLAVGDKVGELQVADLYEDGGNGIAGVIGVEFEGEVEITGVFDRVDTDTFPPFYIGHVLFLPDVDSQSRLPRSEIAPTMDWRSTSFHSPDKEEIVDMTVLEKGQSVAATIRVRDMRYPHLTGFDGHLASFELVEIVELYPKWLELTETGAAVKTTEGLSR